MKTRQIRKRAQLIADAPRLKEINATLLEALGEISNIPHSTVCDWVNPTGDLEPDCNCHRIIATDAIAKGDSE